MITLALDPGRTTGYAVLQFTRSYPPVLIAAGTIAANITPRPTGMHGAHRIRDYTAAGIAQLIIRYEPDVICYEEQVFTSNARDVASQGAYVAADAATRVLNERQYAKGDKRFGAYSPVEIAHTLFGSTRHTDAEFRRRAELLLALDRRTLTPDPGYHKSRAVCVGLTHLVRANGWRPDQLPHLRRSKVAASTLDRITAAREAAVR